MPSLPAFSLTKPPARTFLAFAFANAMSWMIVLGTPMVLLAGELGASALQIGIASAAVFLVLPIQILATSTLPKFGYKAQMIFGWSLRSIFILIPLALAFYAPTDPKQWMVLSLVLSVLLFSIFRSMGSCAVMPWLYSHIPDSVRGRYFATDQMITGISGVLTLLLCSLLFAILPIYQAFTLQYLFAIIGSIASILLLTRIPDGPRPQPTSVLHIFKETPKFCYQPSGFRQYLGFVLAVNLFITSFGPFIAYFLKIELAISSDQIMLYAALQFFGYILGSSMLRNRIDRVGVKPIFRIAFCLKSIVMVFWILVVNGNIHFLHLLPLGYFTFGIATAHWNAANLKYLPRVCPENDPALAVSIHSSITGVTGGITPILWGLFLREPGAAPGIQHNHMIIYLALTSCVFICLFFYIPKLTSEKKHRAALNPPGMLT